MSGLSFKFTKKTVTKLTNGSAAAVKIDEDLEINEDELEKFNKSRRITSLDKHGFTVVDDDDDLNRNSTNQIIIPALANTLQLKPNATNLDDLARNALIEDVLRLKNGADFAQETSKIELSSLGNGQITENRHLDLSDLPDVSEEADYEAVPVHAYGKALLRGLGWKEGQPIGKNVKKIVAPVITAPRPKGLGLGAEIPKPGSKKSGETSQTVRKDEDELVLKIGSYFKTVKEEYGQVVGLDDDNARIIGRLTLSKSTLSLSQHGVRLVTKDEYEKFSKCINKEKYDKYKKEEDEKESKRRRNDDESRSKRSDDRRRSPKRRKSPKKERKRSSERRHHSSKTESTKRSQ